MRGRRRAALGFLVAAALGTTPARAVGTIDTAGATIDSGAAPAKGVVTIDPAAAGSAPALPSITGPGPAPQMTGSVPAAPSFGDGDAGFTAAGDSVFLPGTYELNSFRVLPGGSVTMSGTTTILVAGDVEISGPVTHGTLGGALTFRCSGNFVLNSGSPTVTLETQAEASPIEITAGGGVQIGSGTAGELALVRSAFDDVLVQALGTTAGSRSLTIVSGEVRAPLGAVTLLSASELSVGGSNVSTPGAVESGGGPLFAQAFGSRLHLTEFATLSLQTGAAATLEAAGRFDFDGRLDAFGSSPVTVRAVAGSLVFGGRLVAAAGDVDVSSGGDVGLSRADVTLGNLSSSMGDVSIRAGGAFSIGQFNYTVASGGSAEIVAAGDVDIGSGSVVVPGPLSIRSSAGDVTVHDGASVAATLDVEVRAFGSVEIGRPPDPGKGEPRAASGGATLAFAGRSVAISAGDGGVRIDVSSANVASAGPCSVISRGPIAVARTLRSPGAMTLTSIAGDVDVAQATVETSTQGAAASAPVLVETFKVEGRIDAAGATVRSGGSDVASGNVSLLVHDTTTPPVVVSSYVLPKKVTVKVVEDRPEKTSLAASGFFDTGPGAVDFTAAATVTVGTKQFSVAGLEQRGRIYVHEEEGLAVRIVPARSGSSRAKFRLNAKGAALGGAFPMDGEVVLALEFGAVEGSGRVRLEDGRYAFGRRAGALLEPAVFPVKAKAKLAGAAKDSLDLIAGLASLGQAPIDAPDVTVGFATYSTTIEDASFVPKGGKLVSAGNPRATLDYPKERLVFAADDVTLGAFVEGPQAVTIRVVLDGAVREVRVRMVRKGKKLLY